MNRKEAERWLKQAEADLRSARSSLENEHYEWSCFQAQQSSEKALKSILYLKGLRAIITHSIKDLVLEVAKFDKKFRKFVEKGRFLDTFYIPTRYPNGLPGLNIPADFYTKGDAEKCISYAELILEEVKNYIKK